MAPAIRSFGSSIYLIHAARASGSIQDSDLDGLNVIHVAGTKGKGSTCAYVNSFIQAYSKGALFPRKTGLYTSPHLISETERIRINFQPLSEAAFAGYVFEVRDRLSLNTNEGPGYLQLLALISFHAFIREGVDVAIYETHHGGEFCATNMVTHPAITAITTIGLDTFLSSGRPCRISYSIRLAFLKRGQMLLPCLKKRK